MPPQTRPVTFEPNFPAIVGELSGKPYAAICGANNSGKSYLLKLLKKHLGRSAYLVGPARFYHLNQISSSMKNAREYDNYENNFNNNIGNQEFNFDQNTIGLDKIITNLSNLRRGLLLELCGMLLGNIFTMKHFEDDNDLSPFYIDMDGQNISIGSSGTRILMTLIGLCMDENFNTILIDEPELGLGPKIQLSLSKFFADSTARKNYFPHLSAIYVSTHSHLFLDKRDIGNNFSVDKDKDTIFFSPVRNFIELHKLQFNLLGNSLESLYLPGGFVFVEGKTDAPYIEKIVRSRFPDRNIVVIHCAGNVKSRVHGLKENLGDISKSPFRARIFVILDSVVPNPSLRTELVKMGLIEENVIQWPKNGIEYYYPESIMAEIFACDHARLADLKIDSDEVSLNGVTRRKSTLSEEVCARWSDAVELPEVVERDFLGRISEVV